MHLRSSPCMFVYIPKNRESEIDNELKSALALDYWKGFKIFKQYKQNRKCPLKNKKASPVDP